MKKTIRFTGLILFAALEVCAQGNVGINTNTPDASAALDVSSTTQGMLVPRMTEEQRDGIDEPAPGLLVYQLDGTTPGFYYYNGASWTSLSGSPAGADAGFSATASLSSINTNTQFTGWSVSPPHFSSPDFNAVTGNFTIPTSGKYQISCNISYASLTSNTVSTGPGVTPGFEIRRISPVATILAAAPMPVLDVNIILLLTLRTPLSTASVNLNTTVELTAGDVIGLFYSSNGYTMSTNQEATWQVRKL